MSAAAELRRDPSALRNAARQARFRARRDAELDGYRAQVRVLLDTLADGCELSGCAWVTNNLPEDAHAACGVLAARLLGYRLVPFRSTADEPLDAVEVSP